jgi:hypothetical protein
MSLTPESVAEFAPNYFVAVRNPVFANAEHTVIACEVNFKHVGFEEWTPFAADPNDYMPYSKIIFDKALAGEFGEVAEYVPLPIEDIILPDNAGQPTTQGAQTL